MTFHILSIDTQLEAKHLDAVLAVPRHSDVTMTSFP